MKPLTKQERGKFLSMPAGRVDLLAAMTINKVRATLPFPLGRVKAGCGLIPLAPPGQLNLSVAVLQHLHSLGGFELIKKGARHNDRGYHLKCECEGKHYVETRADRKNDKVDGARQSATKKLGCLVSFDLLELRATDIKKDDSLQHLEPGWYLVGLPMHDHNKDCSNRAYAKATSMNTRADSGISIPRAMVTKHTIDEMLDAAVPLFLYSKMPRKTLFNTICVKLQHLEPGWYLVGLPMHDHNKDCSNRAYAKATSMNTRADSGISIPRAMVTKHTIDEMLDAAVPLFLYSKMPRKTLFNTICVKLQHLEPGWYLVGLPMHDHNKDCSNRAYAKATSMNTRADSGISIPRAMVTKHTIDEMLDAAVPLFLYSKMPRKTLFNTICVKLQHLEPGWYLVGLPMHDHNKDCSNRAYAKATSMNTRADSGISIPRAMVTKHTIDEMLDAAVPLFLYSKMPRKTLFNTICVKLQHLEPGWYLVGLPMHDHNKDCSNRAYAKATSMNTRADSGISIPRAMVTKHTIDEMLDAAVPLFLYSKMPRKTLFNTICVKLQHLEPGWYLVGLPMHDHNKDCSNRAYAKATSMNTRADSGISIPRAMVTKHTIDEMLDAAVPLFLYSKMPRKTLFNTICVKLQHLEPGWYLVGLPMHDHNKDCSNLAV